MFFFVATILPGEAQKYFFDNYSIKDGLSEQKVYTLLQDSKDYIWLGTANGVSRFDGKKFENFTSRDSLATGGVKCIIEDSVGNIWFGHLNGGISRYNGRKFEQLAFDSLMITGDITHIAQIKNKLWFTSANDGAILTDFPVKDIKHIKAKQFREDTKKIVNQFMKTIPNEFKIEDIPKVTSDEKFVYAIQELAEKYKKNNSRIIDEL